MTVKIKEAKTKKKQVENPEALLDRWLDMFSLFIHDLESPLVTIKYLLKIIEEGKFNYENENHKRMTKSSMIALNRSESIIYDLMAVAKSGKTEIPVKLSAVNAKEVIEESIDLSLGSASENDISILFENKTEDLNVLADAKLLKRMIDNLLYNAIRHTGSGENVKVITESKGKAFYIHIKDNGPGLADIDHSKLFEKYGQLELRSEKKHRGVGLGLYFCRLAVSGMKGTIIADDHPEGGAVFTVKLQMAEG